MLFFEVSAKNGENVNKMMYSCIAELPFFEQYQSGNKEDLVKEEYILDVYAKTKGDD